MKLLRVHEALRLFTPGGDRRTFRRMFECFQEHQTLVDGLFLSPAAGTPFRQSPAALLRCGCQVDKWEDSNVRGQDIMAPMHGGKKWGESEA